MGFRARRARRSLNLISSNMFFGMMVSARRPVRTRNLPSVSWVLPGSLKNGWLLRAEISKRVSGRQPWVYGDKLSRVREEGAHKAGYFNSAFSVLSPSGLRAPRAVTFSNLTLVKSWSVRAHESASKDSTIAAAARFSMIVKKRSLSMAFSSNDARVKRPISRSDEQTIFTCDDVASPILSTIACSSP